MDTRRWIRLLSLALVGVAILPARVLAQNGPPQGLGQLSIEDLMDIPVTSASRKEQRTADVAAAVFVITHEDIRRSGLTSIPDLLRLVPGVQVAEINSNKWAVTVRGFNSLMANKLLVLIDGRSVYNRLYSGVIWDEQDPILDDIERIEVTRGPGAALWGANAVNGVINIVTKAAADTQGVLVRVDGGGRGQQAVARYGGSNGSLNYRLFAQWTGREPSLIPPGVSANDRSHSTTTGFRADWVAGPGAFMLEGDLTVAQSHGLWPNLDPQTAGVTPIADVPSDATSGSLLGRWTHDTGGASFQLQTFFDASTRHEPVGGYSRRVLDIDSQYRARFGGHQDLIAGAGYRFVVEGLSQSVGLSLTPDKSRLQLLTAFAQDEALLFGDRLSVTVGSQMQYDSDAGAGLQPTARLLWKLGPRHRIWAATSRALRMPALQDRGIHVTFPPAPAAGGLPLVITLFGNPESETERFIDVEAGYRVEIGTSASVDVTAFKGDYARLQTQEAATPVVEFVPTPRVVVTSTFGNQLDATTRGVEISGRWIPAPAWRFDGSFTSFHLTPRLSAASRDSVAAMEDGSAPNAQWQLRAAFSPSARVRFYGALAYTGRLRQLQVPAYTRADVTFEAQLFRGLSMMVIGQNLFDAAHPEFAGNASLVLPTQVRRGVSLRLRWEFQ